MLLPIRSCRRSMAPLGEYKYFSQPFTIQQLSGLPDHEPQTHPVSHSYLASAHMHRTRCNTGKLVWALDPSTKLSRLSLWVLHQTWLGTIKTETCPQGIRPGWKQTVHWFSAAWAYAGVARGLRSFYSNEWSAVGRGVMRGQPRDWMQTCLMRTWLKHMLLLILSRAQFLVSPRKLWRQRAMDFMCNYLKVI